MTTRIAINGFGRIGRCVLRALIENSEKYSDLEIVALNDPTPLATNAHLLKYDSVHGKFNADIKVENDSLVINGKTIKVFALRNIEDLPWKDLNIDIVMESTGLFRTTETAGKHLTSGAKKVMISAPAKSDDVKTIVLGVNDEQLQSSDTMISIGSCTTNCLAPVVKVLDSALGLVKGHMTTIHSYTNDQSVVDSSHSDLRRARAAAVSMIPTSTGAAKAVGLVLPQIKGKIDGCAIRVPTPNVSFVDLSFESKKETTIEEVNNLIKKAVQGELKGILDYTDEPLVSIDFTHNCHSSIFDVSQTKVVGNNFIRIGSWYDNEWGFSNRMLDIAKIWK